MLLADWIAIAVLTPMTKRKQTKPIIDEPTRSTKSLLFFRWWQENRSRFLIDLHWDPQAREWMEFSFEGIRPALRGFLSDRGVSVTVDHAEVDWDLIFDADVNPKRVRGGYICELCEIAPRRVFADRSALLAHHLFEPLLVWVNEKLAKAHLLVFSGIPKRFTTAHITSQSSAAKHDSSSAWVTHVISLRSPLNESIGTYHYKKKGG